MRRRIQQSRGQLVAGWLLGIAASVVYILTMDRSVSWWDCGEFITTSATLQVGHPPGAPTYQLLAHLFTMLTLGNEMWVAPLSNLLSALSAGMTMMLLYWCIEILLHKDDEHRAHIGAIVGAMCYMCCHTAWFSAVESEVYALAMLMCSLILWEALRWRKDENARRIVLIGLLSGLGVGVHLMTLLVLPAVAVVLFSRLPKDRGLIKVGLIATAFFAIGLSTYAIIPIRATANPPINEGNPSTAEAFVSYLRREQYQHAPLWPRQWRDGDAENAEEWMLGADGTAGELIYYANYQLGWMFLRYFIDNYGGRITNSGRLALFIFPLIVGIVGMVVHRRRRKSDFWTVAMLIVFGGFLLNVYLNHPCYEPRERDYVYALSFFAFAVWIGVGVDAIETFVKPLKRGYHVLIYALIIAMPIGMGAQNWADHDRSHNNWVHDIALNHLQSCDHGALLFTYADNDTFPLWYLQQVEHRRPDISIHNINIEGIRTCMAMAADSASARPVYLTAYATEYAGQWFGPYKRCEGYCWRIMADKETASDTKPLMRHIADSIVWHSNRSDNADPVTKQMLSLWDNLTRHVSELKVDERL